MAVQGGQKGARVREMGPHPRQAASSPRPLGAFFAFLFFAFFVTFLSGLGTRRSGRDELLTAARAQAATDPVWQDEYRRWRPPVERAIAWLVAKGNRRVPHCGVIANNIWLHHRAAALNLRRLINLGLTRTSGTWRLTAALA